MAIRIVLNERADVALKTAVARLKETNPKLCKFQNALVSAAVVELAEGLNESKIKSLTEKLLSRAAKRKLIFDKLGTLVQKLDGPSLESLESGLNKVINQSEKKDMAPKPASDNSDIKAK